MKILKPFFLLIRPLNVLIGMFSIFIGAFITGTLQPFSNVLLACFSGGLITGAANVINDYFDIAIDKINKPYRPIAAGIISPKQGFVFSIFLFILGIICGFIINYQAFLITLVSSVLLYCYSAKLKRTVLWGNLTVSFLTALAFIYGGVAVNRIGFALIPAIFSFFYHFGREIIKDVEDIEGDKADNIMTLPIKYGAKIALRFAGLIYIFLIFLTLLPYIFNIFGRYYLFIVVFVVNMVIIYVLFSMIKDSEPANLSRLSMILKLNMFSGLVAIYCGQF